MSKKEPAAEKPKPTGVLGNKVLILHLVLVFVLLGSLVFQVANYYWLSTDANIRNAIKTNHMAIFDLLTGEELAAMPVEANKVEVAEEENTQAEPAPVAAPNEIAIILSNIGKDAAYASEVAALPQGFIYSFSPYGTKPLESSMRLVEKAGIMAEINYGTGKFDVNQKNTDFRNLNNARAGISKVYSPIAVYIPANAEFAASTSFLHLADDLDTILVVPEQIPNPKQNIVAADIFLKSSTTADELLAGLTRLEEVAKEQGYALAIIEPSPNNVPALQSWLTSLPDKKLKLVTSIKN